MNDADDYKNLGRAPTPAGYHMMQTTPRSDELIACLEGEIAKRDARIVDLEEKSSAADDADFNLRGLLKRGAFALGLDPENTSWFEVIGGLEQLRAELARVTQADAHYQAEALRLAAELAAIKAKEPVEIGEIGIVINNGSKQFVFDEYSAAYALPVGTHYLYAAPVSEAKAQGVVMPELIEKLRAIAIRERMFRIEETYTTPEISDSISLLNNEMDEVARLSAAPVQHPDDAAVDRFAVAMKAKLAASREKGRHGWQNATAPHLSSLLHEHMYKGDPLDVGNLAMMLHQNGQAIELPHDARRVTTPVQQVSVPDGLPPLPWRLRKSNMDSPTYAECLGGAPAFKPVYLEPVGLCIGNTELEWPLAEFILSCVNAAAPAAPAADAGVKS